MRKHYWFPPLTVYRCGCPRSLWVEERGSCHSLWRVHVWFLIEVWLSFSLFLVSCHWEWRGWRGDVGFGWLFPEHPSSMLLAPTAVWLPPFAVEVSTRSRARTRHARAHRLIGVLERMPRTPPPHPIRIQRVAAPSPPTARCALLARARGCSRERHSLSPVVARPPEWGVC